jgi:MFS family permease
MGIIEILSSLLPQCRKLGQPLRGFDLIYGILEGVIGIGGAFGAWVAGFIFDKTQSYQWAFVLAASISIVSCLFGWLAAPRSVRHIRKDEI